MSYYLKKRILPALFSASLLLCACHKPSANAPAQPELPPRAAPIQPVPPVPPDETPSIEPIEELPPDPRVPKTAPNVWDTSDVDISHIDPGHKLISFTFDDAPARTMENILAVFAAFNEANPAFKASATVFCNGYFFDNASTHTLQTAVALGLELGNHSHTHPDLTTLTREEIAAEIDKTDILLEKIDGKRYHLFRAPFGRINDDVKSVVSTPILDWTIDTLDWTDASADDIYNAVWSQKFSGAIVLMHDGYDNTVAALKRLLPDLKKEGYQAVSISQMSKAHACPLRTGSVYIRARKNGTGS